MSEPMRDEPELTTICGQCEREWPTDSGRQVCPECGNDGDIEHHVIRGDRQDVT